MNALYRSTVSIALACALLSTCPALAFVRTRPPGRALPLRWKRPEFELVLRTRELPAGWTRAEVLVALEGAAASWSAPAVACTALQIHVRDGDDLAPGAARDGTSSVTLYSHRFCRGGVERTGNCYDSHTAALTTTQLGQQTATEIELEEADVEVNAADFRFAQSAPGRVPHMLDLQSVLVHEIGHVLGLADNCRLGSAGASRTDAAGQPLPLCKQASEATMRSVMFPAAQMSQMAAGPRRTLARDDVAGVCALYPKHAAAQ